MAKKAINPLDIEVLKACKGYDPKFIDGETNVSLSPLLSSIQAGLLPVVDGNDKGILNYTNISVLYNKKRKVPFVSAYNIDGTLKESYDRKGNFQPDPRIPTDVQLSDAGFYGRVTDFVEFEIGHMASFDEMSWGETVIESKVRSGQTFVFPNSVPQVLKLNTGLWSKLEQYVLKESNDTSTKRICVFTGPMLKDSDPKYIYDETFKVPLFFFKLVVFSYNGKLYSTAFVMSQLKRVKELKLISQETEIKTEALVVATPVPFSDYNHKDVFQVDIELIENYTGLSLTWPKVTKVKVPDGQNKLKEIAETGGADKGKLMTFEAFTEYSEKISVTNMILPGKPGFIE